MTTKELCEKFGVSRTTLMHYRKGQAHARTVKGVVYQCDVPPVLEEGVDYTWEKGDIVYNKSAAKKIKAFREGK